MPSAKAKAAEPKQPEQVRTLPQDHSLSKLLFGNQAAEFARMRQLVANANWLISCLSSLVSYETASAALLKKFRSKIPACPNPAVQNISDTDPRALLEPRMKLSASYSKALRDEVIAPLSKIASATAKQLASVDKEHTKAYAQLSKFRANSDKMSGTVLKLYDQAKRLEEMGGLDPKNKAKAQAALAKAQVADGKYRAEVTKVAGCEADLDTKIVSYLDTLEKLDIALCEAYNRALLRYAELTSTYYADYQGPYGTLKGTVAAKDVVKTLMEFALENKSTAGSTMQTTVYKDLSGTGTGAVGASTSSDGLGTTNVVVSGMPEDASRRTPRGTAEPAPASAGAASNEPAQYAAEKPAEALASAAAPDPAEDAAPATPSSQANQVGPAGVADTADESSPEIVSAPVPTVSEAADEQPPTAYDASLQGTVKNSLVVE